MAWIEKQWNKYHVCWRVKTSSGTKKRSLSFDSKAAAERYKLKLEYEASVGISFDPSNMTFGEYLDYWLPIHAESRKKTLKPKTKASYQSNIVCHIKPHLGNIKLTKLAPLHLQTFYDTLLKEGRQDLLKRQVESEDPEEVKTAKTKLAKIEAGKMQPGLSATSVAYIHRIINASLKQALRWQMVGTNIAEAVEPPQPEPADIEYLDRGQVGKFLAIIKESPDYPIIATAIMTGMRQGEILGLRWQDVDFDKGLIHVRQQSQYTPEKGFFFTAPKQNSKRDVPMQLPLSSILRTVKKEQDAIKSVYEEVEAEYHDLDLVFCREDGSQLDGCLVTKRFQKLLTKNGFPRIRFHSLRHTFATMCRGAGIAMEDIQDLLGHADISTTKKMYTHVEIEPLVRAMDKLSEYMDI